MKLIFTSYSGTSSYDQPEAWLKRINGYTGILEKLSLTDIVTGIERINYEGVYEQNGVQYYFTRLKKRVSYFPRSMHRLVKRLRPDVVFVNGLIFPLQIIQLRLKLGSHVKIIVLHRAEKPFNGIKKYVQKLADKCVDAYLFTSAESGEEWQSNINVKKKMYEVIQASSVFYTIKKEAALQVTQVKGDPVFLWVGMLIARKDPLTVIKAFLEFLPYQSGAKLYMIYQTSELLDEINTLLGDNEQYRDAIRLVGRVPHEQLLYWYNSADFFVTASHYEGSGVALSEAMSCGCIPITSDFMTFKKMTGNGKCGLMFGLGNEKMLATVFRRAIELDLEKERAKVLQQFREELSFEAIAKKITKIILNVRC